ncbi:MAG: insulinase family protein [Elusimicrobia bacterium]|nr:insulinase family protein [Elusimicrobiota bacterium]
MSRSILVSALLACAPPFLAAQPAPEAVQEGLDRATPVPPGPARPFQIQPPQEAALKTGLRIAVSEVRRLPIVSVRVVLPLGGSAFDPQGKEGLSAIVASLLTEGTRNLDGLEFAQKLAELGASVAVEAGSDSMTATLFAGKESLDKALGLLARAIRSPALEASQFARLQQEAVVEFQQAKGDPGWLAERRLKERVFGGHPYGRGPDEATVAALTLADVRSFHARHLRPEGAVLAASGDVSLPELQALAAKHFGSWRPAAAALPQVPAIAEAGASPAQGMVIDVIDMPGSEQSAIRAGHRSISRDAPDYYAVAVMNFVLGQASMLSRLNQNLRETHGWAYGAGSRVNALKQGGWFMVSANVQSDATAKALREILGELSRMRTGPVPDDELDTDKRLMAGLFVLQQQTIQAISSQVAGIELYGLPKDTLAKHRDRVLAVTAAEVQAAAQAHLRASDLEIVITGDAAKIRAELGQIAPIRVLGVDGKPAAPAPAGQPGS